jgi:hypothetical protein
VLSDFDESDSTYFLRWHQLETQLDELFQLAQERSHERPSLILLPVLTDFHKGAFDEPLRRVGQLAEDVGFRVVNTMPAFLADGAAAEHYRAAPNDLHLNPLGNKIVADVLFRLVTETSTP